MNIQINLAVNLTAALKEAETLIDSETGITNKDEALIEQNINALATGTLNVKNAVQIATMLTKGLNVAEYQELNKKVGQFEALLSELADIETNEIQFDEIAA